MTLSNCSIGYCTNVHAGVDLDSIRKNLDMHAVAARIASRSDELGVGLWLPSHAASQIAGEAEGFASFLQQRGLRPFTINGFPYANFHEPVVKHRVYRPAWWQQERLDYTKQLADILVQILPDSEPIGSISTLPIGWASDVSSPALLDQAGANLRELSKHLEQIESSTGRRIVVAIEPEPGCVLDTTDDLVEWFETHLQDKGHRQYITVCHDICHAAVMMERQADVIEKLGVAGITIGKVQVSSAIVADWNTMAVGRRREAIEQLKEFAEDRYLHQTGRRTSTGGFELAEDLPQLLSSVSTSGDPVWGDEKWIVHFHVPIFLERFGHLTTTRDDVLDCLGAVLNLSDADAFTGHLEIETYAWTVLPESMRKRELSDDIASEIRWLREAVLESS